MRSRWAAYGIAVVSVALVAGLCWFLESALGLNPRAGLLLIIPVALSSWRGGLGPGILATALGVLASPWIWTEIPQGDPELRMQMMRSHVASTILFLLDGVALSWLMSTRWQAITNLEQTNRRLEKRVRQRTEELEQANAALREQIHQKGKVTQELQVQSQELQRINQELQEFASVASHDLQEPLRKIRAFGDRLATRCGDQLGADGRDYLERILGAASRMQVLINDLLTFSRVTTRAQPFQRISLREQAEAVLSDLETRIEQSGAQVELGDLPAIEADPTQIRQLFQNLISNALKFQPPDGQPRIDITAQLVTDSQVSGEQVMCEIEVKDNGIGFDERYLDRIFEIFQRLHGRGSYQGTGIGLAVCRKIVDRHGGTISATSHPGKGATFVVRLPTRQVAGPSLENEPDGRTAPADHDLARR